MHAWFYIQTITCLCHAPYYDCGGAVTPTVWARWSCCAHCSNLSAVRSCWRHTDKSPYISRLVERKAAWMVGCSQNGTRTVLWISLSLIYFIYFIPFSQSGAGQRGTSEIPHNCTTTQYSPVRCRLPVDRRIRGASFQSSSVTIIY